MAIAHRWKLPSGYYAVSREDYGLLPSNATYKEPVFIDGYWPCWNGEDWEQVEDHKGEQGFVNGEPFTIKDYGPYPAGWSKTPPPPTPEEIAEATKAQFTAAIQQYLDNFAKTRNYDGVDSMAKYLGCSVTRFAVEAAYMRDAVAETWITAYVIMDAVLAGQRPVPTEAELFAELPALQWPDEV